VANENLKDALRSAGLTAEQFAQIIDVDPKTVQRWVSGRTPYPRHRATVARALDLTEHELWPADTPLPAVTDRTGTGPGVMGDVTGSWGQDTDPDAPDPIALIGTATDRVDVLDDGRGVIRTLGLVDALLDRAQRGCQVRVLTYQPSRELYPLIGDDRIELLVFEAPPGHTMIRAGDQMLVTFSFVGDAGEPPPLLQLRRQTDGGLFDRLIEHYELLAEHVQEIITDRQQLDDYLIDEDEEDEEDDQDDDDCDDDDTHTDHEGTPTEPQPTGDHGSVPDEPPAPRRWPRRTG